MSALAFAAAGIYFLFGLAGLAGRGVHPLLPALAAPLAALGASLFDLTASPWGDGYTDALFIAAAWLPLWLVSLACMYSAFIDFMKRGKPGRGFWLFTVAASLASAYFAYTGALHHPVEELVSVGNAAWLLLMLGLAEGVTAENAAGLDEELRRTMFIEAAFTAAFGGLFALWEQMSHTGAYSFSSPLLALAAGTALLGLAAAYRRPGSRSYHLTAAALLFMAVYGFLLEFP